MICVHQEHKHFLRVHKTASLTASFRVNLAAAPCANHSIRLNPSKPSSLSAQQPFQKIMKSH